jgi:hypothetical protein
VGELVTLTGAATAICDKLRELQNAPHEEHAGPLCPICGLTTAMLAALREELDALALREHFAAQPTPPSGPSQGWEKVEVEGELSPPKTTMFRKPDGSPLIEITLTHTFSRTTGLRRRRTS